MNNPFPSPIPNAQSPQDFKSAPSPLSGQDLEALAAFAKEQAAKVFDKVPMLGVVAWLMIQQSATRHTLLSELEWRVMPALVLDQAKIFMRDNAPIAYVSWARLSESSATRYQNAPHHLTSADWKSGDQCWIVDLIAPFGGAPEIMSDLRDKVLAGQVVHHLSPSGMAIRRQEIQTRPGPEP